MALRLSVDERRHFSGFTCPGCRSRHSIATLPGFEQETATATAGSRTRIARTRTNSTAEALRHAFGLASGHAARGGDDGSGPGNAEGAAVIEIIDNDDDDDDDDDSDDDDSYNQEGGSPRWAFRISSERIYVDINTLNVHSR